MFVLLLWLFLWLHSAEKTIKKPIAIQKIDETPSFTQHVIPPPNDDSTYSKIVPQSEDVSPVQLTGYLMPMDLTTTEGSRETQKTKDYWVIISCRLSPKWYIYSPSAKNSQMIPTILLDLPKGSYLGSIHWPEPIGIPNYDDDNVEEIQGYTHHCTLAIPVYNLPIGEVPYAKVKMIACSDVCKPVNVSLTLEVLNEDKDHYYKSILDKLSTNPIKTQSLPQGLIVMLILAFLGGLLLNLMPCVLPVLSLKILSITKNPHQRIENGLYFGLGNLISFWILGACLIGLRFAGHNLGWGFQLQHPIFIGVLICVFWFISLNLFGLFEIGTSLTRAQLPSSTHHNISSFGNGMLSCVIATPCTAPFMGTALAFALSQPWWSAMGVFTGISLGMSFPYLLFCFLPRLSRFLPKPGKWMIVFRHFLGFCLTATVIWLLHVLAHQVSLDHFLLYLWGILSIGLGSWLLGYHQFHPQPRKKQLLRGLGVWALLIGSMGYTITIPKHKDESFVMLEPFHPKEFDSLMADQQPILLVFSAKWCLTCVAQNRLFFGDKEVLDFLKQQGVHSILADWTNHDPIITKSLKQYDHQSIPLYVIYDGMNMKPTYIGSHISKNILKKALEKTSKKYIPHS